MLEYKFNEVESKWRKYWEESQLHKTDLKKSDKKCYTLVMFSYPSAAQLHLGHWFNYGPTDTWARLKRMQGYNIFQPMGFDSFGLPAENYAIKTQIHPHESTMSNIGFMEEQLKNIGAMYDWNYELFTSEPDYYKGTQWLFLQLYKHKLAYRAKAPVNWCPGCATVLANEQVVDGECERCSSPVTKKNLTQWFFKITDHADRLLNNLKDLDWPEETKAKQTNWIGRSEGAQVTFEIADSGQTFDVFTTRPDTLFGVTYVVFAPEHPMVNEIVTEPYRQQVEAYQEEAKHLSEIERTSTVREKKGVFTGAYAINPVNQEKVPIWVADYVLVHYGTGIVMAVPGHDERDFEFAKTNELPIRKVILEPGTHENAPLQEAYTGPGKLTNSFQFNSVPSERAKQMIVADLAQKNLGKQTVNYRLRDWLVSRQRFWGSPIPIIYCDDCGEVPVPEEQLPVKLPHDVDFNPTGESPLARNEDFMNVACPTCKKPAKREADTMDTFVCSSWYFLRYPNAKRESLPPFDSDLVNQWLPVDKYVGGPEHACMHLLYARFVTQALHDMGFINFEEPFKSLTHQGIILGPDGYRMSKSKGNVVSPGEYIDEYGSDVFRCYLMFCYSYIEGGPWNDEGIKAIARFFNRIWRLQEKLIPLLSDISPSTENVDSEADQTLHKVRHQSLQGVSQDAEKFQFNTPIARLMELVNGFYAYINQPQEQYNLSLLKHVNLDFIKMLAPFAPHISEEYWSKAGQEGSVFNAAWPEFDASALVEDNVELVIQINGKVKERMTVPTGLSKDDLEERAKNTGRMPQLLENKTIRKAIIVPERLVNLVVS